MSNSYHEFESDAAIESAVRALCGFVEDCGEDGMVLVGMTVEACLDESQKHGGPDLSEHGDLGRRGRAHVVTEAEVTS